MHSFSSIEGSTLAIKGRITSLFHIGLHGQGDHGFIQRDRSHSTAQRRGGHVHFHCGRSPETMPRSPPPLMRNERPYLSPFGRLRLLFSGWAFQRKPFGWLRLLVTSGSRWCDDNAAPTRQCLPPLAPSVACSPPSLAPDPPPPLPPLPRSVPSARSAPPAGSRLAC